MFYSILFIAISAMALTYIFTYVFKNPGPWKSFWAFLAVLFMGMFAFSLWVNPMGPLWYNIAWVDTLLVGLVMALMLGAAGEVHGRRYVKNKKGEVDLVGAAKADEGAIVIFGIFFWIFLMVLSIIIVFGLLRLFNIL